MSQISVLGFSSADSSAPYASSSALHWAILLSPTAEIIQQQQKGKEKRRPRFFSRRQSSKSALFDMHNHQLRQQEFPIPVPTTKSESETESDSSSSPLGSNSNTAPASRIITTSISSPIAGKPQHLTLRIKLGTHHSSVSKLGPKLSTLLYCTPTYGSEDDWLRAALDMLVSAGILEPPATVTGASFDADAVLEFAGEAVKEYLASSQPHQQPQTETNTSQGRNANADGRSGQVLELDYASHLTRIAEVKAMFAHHTAQSLSPASTSTPTPAHAAAKSQERRSRTTGSNALMSSYKFLGFRIAPSPSSYCAQQYRARRQQKYNSFQRQDDPYSGLM
ncbi:uncharacterized protein Z518_04537 [Rhinocladiella mackenziei CBS 650.93]|uniref:Rhinocladiella mackenziei CBS 650.93 unplaced genomic scaffold supercont1.3, whole genome shotgun sequence n=1 Tax=Rhinocladiella mackenziei CBS 650.93 TaxID=1442369 RepID=A0A0D2ITT0_9EURO|nr:uncharacterized protein Z518_04537 [Rhinocladiella mackenziei CBS 650.93]KIX06561.1 hypothetical protein Z518_04537 [Rhinocladiella mackenziei CBS 650.93]